jgi:nicotinamide riboside transporter PnuC
MSENIKEFISSIPEFFYDLIARLIPGSIFIVLYIYELPSKSEELNVLTISFAIIISYFLGIIFSLIGTEVWGLMLFNHKELLKIYFPKNVMYTDQYIWNISRSSFKPADRKLITKMMAEKTMFCSTSLIFFIALIFPPYKIFFINTCHMRSCFIILFLIMTFCMITMHKWICLNVDNLQGR